MGYAYTHYGNRTVNETENDVDKYCQWYNVNGIFFDEASSWNFSNQIAYYQTSYKYVQSNSSKK